MVMEFLEGLTLGSLLATRGHLEIIETMDIILPVISAVAAVMPKELFIVISTGEHLPHARIVGRSQSQGARLWCLEADRGRVVCGADGDHDGAGTAAYMSPNRPAVRARWTTGAISTPWPHRVRDADGNAGPPGRESFRVSTTSRLARLLRPGSTGLTVRRRWKRS